MNALELISLPVILLLGIITSYQDIKFGKIKNKWIILSLLYAFLIYELGISFYIIQGQLNLNYVIELVTNFLFAITIGFGLWFTRVWTAGDGKLFIAYATLIPFSFYSLGYQKFVPSVTLLINIFIIAFVILLVTLLFKSKIKDLKKVSLDFIKEFFRAKKFGMMILRLFAIFWIVDLGLNLFGTTNILLRISLTMILMLIVQKKLKKISIYLFLGVVLLRLFVDPNVYTLNFLIHFLYLIFGFIFLFGFLSQGPVKLGQEIFSKKIKVNKLKPGMVVHEFIIDPKKSKKENLENLKIDSEGLTTKQIEFLKKRGIKEVEIAHTIPFAPFMFLGVLITLICKGNLFSFLRTIIGQ